MNSEQITYVKHYLRDCKVSLLGKLIYSLGLYRKKVVTDNIELVFTDHLSALEKKKLAIAFYTHLLKMITEFIQFGFMSKKKICDNLTVVGMEHILPLLNDNKPMLFLTGHFGNWEYFLASCPLKYSILRNKLSIIRKKINPIFIENFIHKKSERNGVIVLRNDQGLKKIITGFKKGISFLFVFDQYAHPSEGILVNFFGKPTGTYKMAAQLALKFNLPIIFISGYRNKDNQHVIEIHPPLEWITVDTFETEIQLNTQAFNHAIEDIILKHPEQWIWSHRRWKHHDGY